MPVLVSCSVHMHSSRRTGWSIQHLGLLHTCDAFAIVEQPAAGCQAIRKAFGSYDNTQLCPWAFLTGQRIRVGFFCIMHVIKDIWQSDCCLLDPGYHVRIETQNLDPVGPYLELNFMC